MSDLSTPARELPLRISKTDQSHYSVVLAGVELSHVLLADGCKIELVQPVPGEGPSQPKVTLVFAPGAIDLDLDAVLVEYLTSQKSDDSAVQA